MHKSSTNVKLNNLRILFVIGGCHFLCSTNHRRNQQNKQQDLPLQERHEHAIYYVNVIKQIQVLPLLHYILIISRQNTDSIQLQCSVTTRLLSVTRVLYAI